MDIKKQAGMVKETMEQLPEWLGGKGKCPSCAESDEAIDVLLSDIAKTMEQLLEGLLKLKAKDIMPESRDFSSATQLLMNDLLEILRRKAGMKKEEEK